MASLETWLRDITGPKVGAHGRPPGSAINYGSTMTPPNVSPLGSTPSAMHVRCSLQRALQNHGIAADITYLSKLQTCVPGRYTVVDRNLHGMSTNIGERSISVTLPPGAVQDGETFVLTWSVLSMSADELKAAGISSGPGTEVGAGFRLSINADIATGPVKPCEPISATPP
jgi:hypothetical protein